MSSMVLSGDTSGAITVTVPAVAGTNTITLPAATGTVLVSGNQPAFSVYGTAVQSTANITQTKAILNTKEFDTANAFDATTNYRFTPQVAGYYQFSALMYFAAGSATGTASVSLYKNGSQIRVGALSLSTVANVFPTLSALAYANGTTDYFELYLYQNSGGALNAGTNQITQCFSGVLVRAA